ncbi:MAG: NAD(P)-dependent oxidoreductase [Clostridia bacterium]|nr:NAD(P)-dependent oxidoreductase [Clostridia bacterium]
MKIVILDGDTMGEDIDFSPIKNIGETVVYGSSTAEECAERICDADVVILNKIQLTSEILERGKKLKLVCIFAVGYNNIDVDYCKRKNIRVRNVPGYCSQSVCQHTFALLFALMENLRYYDDFVKSGKYSKCGTANHLGKPFGEVAGKKWGIIGMGAIGRSIGDCAAAFGAEVRYATVSGAKRTEKYPQIPMEEILRTSDIITLSTPLNEKTYHLIGEKELASLKDGAYIINVSRGAVIDEDALAYAIDNGNIGGVGIDVYSQEPPLPDMKLLNVKNSHKVIFTPHIAWASVEARRRNIQMTADNIKAFINGEKLNDVW